MGFSCRIFSVFFIELFMTEVMDQYYFSLHFTIESLSAVKAQKAAANQIKLTYRGVAYLKRS